MWTVVYIAQSIQIATDLQKLLETKGILVKMRPVSKENESCNNYCEILVPENEVQEAHNIIIEKGY